MLLIIKNKVRFVLTGSSMNYSSNINCELNSYRM